MIPGNPNGQVWIAKDKRKIEPVARSSKLYPYYLTDSLGVTFTGISETAFRGSYDRFGIAFSSSIQGSLVEPLVTLFPLKDTIGVTISPVVTGALAQVLNEHPFPNKDLMGVTFNSDLSGALTTVLVEHPYRTPEVVAVTFSPTITGSLV